MGGNFFVTIGQGYYHGTLPLAITSDDSRACIVFTVSVCTFFYYGLEEGLTTCKNFSMSKIVDTEKSVCVSVCLFVCPNPFLSFSVWSF